MKIFLDTSALIKLYFREQGTEDVDLLRPMPFDQMNAAYYQWTGIITGSDGTGIS